jgi:hypothetical protein
MIWGSGGRRLRVRRKLPAERVVPRLVGTCAVSIRQARWKIAGTARGRLRQASDD